QPPVPSARPRRPPRALGPEIEQPSVPEILELRKEEPAPVAEIGVVSLELVSVIPQRQRLLERSRQRREAAEMLDPLGVGQLLEPDQCSGALVAVAQDVLREAGGFHRIVEALAQMRVIGAGTMPHRAD